METTVKEGCAKSKVEKTVQEGPEKETKDPPNPDDGSREVSDIMLADVQRLCYNEVKEKGSCFKGNSCNFSHDIPEEIKQNKEKVLNIIGQKRLCINEYNNCILFVLFNNNLVPLPNMSYFLSLDLFCNFRGFHLHH